MWYQGGWLSEKLSGTTPYCRKRSQADGTKQYIYVSCPDGTHRGRGRDGLCQRSIHLLRTKIVEIVALFLLLSGRPIQLHRKLSVFVMMDLVCVLWILTAKGQFTHARKQSTISVVITRPSLQQSAYPKPRQTNKISRETDARETQSHRREIRFGFKDVQSPLFGCSVPLWKTIGKCSYYQYGIFNVQYWHLKRTVVDDW